MVTKSALSSLTTITGYTELKTKLTAYEVELRRDRDIQPGQALFSKSMKGGRKPYPLVRRVNQLRESLLAHATIVENPVIRFATVE